MNSTEEMIAATPECMRTRSLESISLMLKDWFAFNIQEILNEKMKSQRFTFLDIGGGKGVLAKDIFTNAIIYLGKDNCHTTNCDYNPGEQPSVQNIKEDFNKASIPQNIDLITAIASIDYMDDSLLALEKALNALSKDGTLVAYFMKGEAFAKNYKSIIQELQKANNTNYEIKTLSYKNNKRPEKAYYDNSILLIVTKKSEENFINPFKLTSSEKGLPLSDSEKSRKQEWENAHSQLHRNFEDFVQISSYTKKEA